MLTWLVMLRQIFFPQTLLYAQQNDLTQREQRGTEPWLACVRRDPGGLSPCNKVHCFGFLGNHPHRNVRRLTEVVWLEACRCED
jgi:hypothetical protein